MSPRRRLQSLPLSLVATIALGLMASSAVQADEPELAVVPAPGLSWDDASGDGAVEASRATTHLAPATAVIINQVPSDVRWAPALEPSLAVMAAAKAWDTSSGYGAVEAIRAGASAVLAPVERTTQVSGDVRWAPARTMEADLGSGRGGLRAAVLVAARAWDETSGYGAVEASRAVASALIGSSDAADRART